MAAPEAKRLDNGPVRGGVQENGPVAGGDEQHGAGAGVEDPGEERDELLAAGVGVDEPVEPLEQGRERLALPERGARVGAADGGHDRRADPEASGRARRAPQPVRDFARRRASMHSVFGT